MLNPEEIARDSEILGKIADELKEIMQVSSMIVSHMNDNHTPASTQELLEKYQTIQKKMSECIEYFGMLKACLENTHPVMEFVYAAPELMENDNQGSLWG